MPEINDYFDYDMDDVIDAAGRSMFRLIEMKNIDAPRQLVTREVDILLRWLSIINIRQSEFVARVHAIFAPRVDRDVLENKVAFIAAIRMGRAQKRGIPLPSMSDVVGLSSVLQEFSRPIVRSLDTVSMMQECRV